MSEHEERVRRGIELLDRHPNAKGWRDAIDPDKLHMADGCGCILGQTFGQFDDGLHALGLEWGDAVEYGFLVDDDSGYEWDARHTRAKYGWLTRAWRKALGRV